jgi:hypothetical protein
VSDLAYDPTLIDWHGRDGLHYRARWRDGILVFKPRLRGIKDMVVWASGKSNYYISKLLNQFWNAAAFSFPSPLFFAGWTASLTAASTGATAGEAAYTGYARVSVTANTTNFPTSSGGAAIQNATAITFPANAGSLSTWTFAAVLDVATLGAGNILFWGSITSTAINPGDTPQINVNGLTASEA